MLLQQDEIAEIVRAAVYCGTPHAGWSAAQLEFGRSCMSSHCIKSFYGAQ